MSGAEILDIISIITSVVLSIVIAVIQWAQGNRVEKLACRQDRRDANTRKQQVEAQRNSFISKYSKDREIRLLPLCWISSYIMPAHCYGRAMYVEYNTLERDVQEAICDKLDLHIFPPHVEGEELLLLCGNCVEMRERQCLREGHPMIYQGNKYLIKALQNGGSTRVSNNFREKLSGLMDALGAPEGDDNPIESFIRGYEGRSGQCSNAQNEPYAIVSMALSLLSCRSEYRDDHWTPNDYTALHPITLEDLSLWAYYYIYIYLIEGNLYKILHQEISPSTRQTDEPLNLDAMEGYITNAEREGLLTPEESKELLGEIERYRHTS